jgi:MscS family membrane protein
MDSKRVLTAVFLLLGILLTACGSIEIVGTVSPSATVTPTATSTPVSAALVGTPEPTAPATEEGRAELLLNTPTPAPTATPGPLSDLVSIITYRSGLSRVTFLGLSVEDWLNLGVSLLIVLGAVLLVARIIFALLVRAATRSKNEYISIFLQRIHGQIRWLVGIFGLQYATIRLAFLSPEIKTMLDRTYTGLYVLILTWIGWRLIDTVVEWYREEIEPKHPEHQTDALLVLVSRGARLFLLSISLTMLLALYNINVSALIAALGIAGLAISLAAQDTLSNMISGVIILLDQPFRVGDRIEVQGVGTWGDVVDIGLRSTRIRTRDNRMVIVPNAKIGSDQVINYSFPDPQYRIEIEVGIGYGQDVETVRRTIIDAVRPVEGVLKDKPVEALYVKMAEQAMIFRIRWWIESYVDARRMFDRVNTALQIALDETGIESPFQTYNLQMKRDD